MSKILRKEVENDIPGAGGMNDLMDELIYTFYNITSNEFDDNCEYATDKEIADFANGLGKIDKKPTFSEVRKGIIVRNRYVKHFQKLLITLVINILSSHFF